MDKLTEHISYVEATKTSQKLDNTPNEKQLKAMKELALNVFEPLRIWAGEPIRVNSFFRSEAVNRKIGGAKNSQHKANDGSAIDISAMSKKNNADLFNYILKNLDFDQLIWEFGNDKIPGWVHVSYCTERKNRKQVLKAIKVGHITKYLPYAKK
jgi:zinc D-Ala-D-Ala carboxypeptidase